MYYAEFDIAIHNYDFFTLTSAWAMSIIKLLFISYMHVQWNPSITATLGEQNVGRYNYRGVPLLRGCFVQIVHLGPGFLAVIQRWP